MRSGDPSAPKSRILRQMAAAAGVPVVNIPASSWLEPTTKPATPYNYTEPDWKPLERAVTAAGLPLPVCGEFMWMCEPTVGTHQYKHRDTRRYAVLFAIPLQDDARKVIEARSMEAL